MRVTAYLATELTQRIIREKRESILNGEELREYLDIKTGGELDCFQLDLLTDMVSRNLRRAVVISIKFK